MTDDQARRWHEDQLRDLRGLIDRAKTTEALHDLYLTRRREIDASPELTRHLQQRMTALKAAERR